MGCPGRLGGTDRRDQFGAGGTVEGVVMVVGYEIWYGVKDIGLIDEVSLSV